ncbi:LysR family transcriptional regulator [Turicimonas muris]|uniref:LysR family transcriptional regulator n=1 Tax=Turicimonas muris TaxID=1796652 RepID=UPI002675B3F6|nr:LysR family transcriptional regulator [Turicimonas muris]
MGVKNLEQLTLGDLQFLMALERADGITKAGEAMNLSPSTASRTLKRIREILGDSCSSMSKTDWWQRNTFPKSNLLFRIY